MDLHDPASLAALFALVFAAAVLYSSVGHGGASAYLALLAIFGAPAREAASTALVLNCLVAGVAFATYARAGFFSWRLLLPFAVASVPAAYLGGSLEVSGRLYAILLCAALLAAAARLWVHVPAPEADLRPPSLPVAVVTGGALGFLAGLIGIGGGIFLSPLVLLRRWAGVRTTAGVAASFILVNSLAGIAGRAVHGHFAVANLLPLLLAAGAGGLVGSRLGAHRLGTLALCRLLAVVLLVALGRKVMLAA